MADTIGDKLIGAVRYFATLKPNFVYDRPKGYPGTEVTACHYVYQGAPSCIVGWAAWYIGLIDDRLEDRDVNQAGVDELDESLGWDIPQDQLNWLATVQFAQDNGEQWADAVAAADAEYYVAGGPVMEETPVTV